MKVININKDLNINPIKDFKYFLNPEYIYIPIKDVNKLNCKKNDEVLKGSLIYKDIKNTIYSPISGKIKNLIKLKRCNYLLIQNDYKETTLNNGKSRRIKGMSKESFISYINSSKIKSVLTHNINILYINCFDIDPYIYNRYMYLKENFKEIIEMLEHISNIFKINKIYLVVSSDYQEIIDKYSKLILQTGNISFKIVNNIYPIGIDDLLKKNLITNSKENLLNLDDIINIIYDVKKNRPILEKYITINGNKANEKIVMNVKKYTLLNDVLRITNNLIDNVKYLKNNSLYSYNINTANEIIDEELNGVIINETKQIKDLPCNNCGLCYNVCPYKINPLIKNDKCIKCGLCNYVCPHKINVIERYQK